MKHKLLLTLVFMLVFGYASAERIVRIPVVYGQLETPIYKYVAAEDLRGAMIAAEELNAAGGILGRRVEIADLKAVSVIDAVAKVREILSDNDIPALVGANTSNISLAIAPVLQAAKMPMISPISTNPKVTEFGDYIFRACFTDPFQGEVMSDFATAALHAKTAVIITKVDSFFSTGLAEVFRKSFSEKGDIIWEGTYISTDTDFHEILLNVRRLKPDVVFVPGHGKDVGLLLRQAYAMGIKTIFLGGDGWGKGALGVAGPEAAEGNYFANHWNAEMDTKESRKFVDEYNKMFGQDSIAASAALSYDSVMLIANAIKTANSFDRKAVREALAKTDGFKGVTGVYRFDEKGDPIAKRAVIHEYKNGKIVYAGAVTP